MGDEGKAAKETARTVYSRLKALTAERNQVLKEASAQLKSVTEGTLETRKQILLEHGERKDQFEADFAKLRKAVDGELKKAKKKAPQSVPQIASKRLAEAAKLDTATFTALDGLEKKLIDMDSLAEEFRDQALKLIHALEKQMEHILKEDRSIYEQLIKREFPFMDAFRQEMRALGGQLPPRNSHDPPPPRTEPQTLIPGGGSRGGGDDEGSSDHPNEDGAREPAIE